MVSSLSAVLLGIALGARHALDPDHLAAVSVLVTEAPHPKSGALLGALWGVGHTAALLTVAFVLAALSTTLPETVAAAFELGVALMLILLGVRALTRAARAGGMGPPFAHVHGSGPHAHTGSLQHVHVGRWVLAARPAVIGLVHGLAGSGMLTAFAASKLPSLPGRLTFIALFGAGSILGMTTLSVLAGWSATRLLRSDRAARILLASTGALSVVIGAALGWPVAAGHF
jgi:hypothetical protein